MDRGAFNMDGKIIAGAMLVGMWLLFSDAVVQALPWLIGAAVVLYIVKSVLHF